MSETYFDSGTMLSYAFMQAISKPGSPAVRFILITGASQRQEHFRAEAARVGLLDFILPDSITSGRSALPEWSDT